MLPLVRDVNSPASQRSSQQPPKQRSLFISEVNSSLHEAHHREVKNSLNVVSHLTGGLVPPCKQVLALDLEGQLCLCFPGPGSLKRKMNKKNTSVLFFQRRQSFSVRASVQSGPGPSSATRVLTVRLAAAWV